MASNINRSEYYLLEMDENGRHFVGGLYLEAPVRTANNDDDNGDDDDDDDDDDDFCLAV